MSCLFEALRAIPCPDIKLNLCVRSSCFNTGTDDDVIIVAGDEHDAEAIAHLGKRDRKVSDIALELIDNVGIELTEL